MSETQSIRRGSVWRFKGLDEPKRFKVHAVSRGRNGSVQYVTEGQDEAPTKRPRTDFLAHFEPIA